MSTAVPSQGSSSTTAARASSPPQRNPLDIRAEEDAARRINVGRALISGETGGLGNTSDLFGRGALRSQLTSLARENGVSFDEDALQYLALAAESRLRQLLSETLSVQTHRTSSHHLRPPPLTSSGKPSWSHNAIDDPTAILEAMNQQNKAAEQAFRADRMTRIAKETEIQRHREREREDEEPEEPSGSASGPSTPARPSNPVFGAVSVGNSDKKKKSGKKAMVTAEVQHKMSNLTAMRSIGGGKKYSWMSSSPSVSSPLAGKKRKKEAEGVGSSLNPNNLSDGKDGASVKEEEGDGRVGTSNQSAPDVRPPKKKRRNVRLTDPTRRQVVVSRENGVERKQTDDRVLTLQDVLFVLERDGVGRGMGTGDDLVRKLWVLGGVGQKAP